jgi:hypothetical protein
LAGVFVNGIRQLQNDFKYKYSGGQRLIKFSTDVLSGMISGEDYVILDALDTNV